MPPIEAEEQYGESCDVITVPRTLHCSIHNNENHGSDAERLPDLDELLVSSFNPTVSNNDEEVGRQENADSLALELKTLSIQAIFAGYPWQGFGIRDSHNQTL